MLRKNWEQKQGSNIHRTRSLSRSRCWSERPRREKSWHDVEKFLRKLVVKLRMEESHVNLFKEFSLVTGNILLSSMSNVYLFVFYYFHPSILDYFHPIHHELWSKSMKGTSRLAQVILKAYLCGFAWACWLAPHPPSAAGSSSRNRESHTRAPSLSLLKLCP